MAGVSDAAGHRRDHLGFGRPVTGPRNVEAGGAGPADSSDDLSPLLGVPTDSVVATPRSTPPSPRAASTRHRTCDGQAGGAARTRAWVDGEEEPGLGVSSRAGPIQFTYADSFHRRASSIADDESMGILDADAMDADSTLVAAAAADSFAFLDVSAIGKKAKPPSAADGLANEGDCLFKAPLALPPRTRRVLGLPASLMAEAPVSESHCTTLESVASTNVSEANQSSFQWDKVAAALDDADGTNSSRSAESVVPLGGQTNGAEDSFATGQFSARSTSIGGSCAGSDKSGAKTRDERFSDFSGVFSLHKDLSGAAGLTATLKDGLSFGTNRDGESGQVNDSGFEGLRQSFGDDFEAGNFQSDGARGLMDAAEVEFDNENNLLMSGSNGDVSCQQSDGFNSSLSSCGKSRSELLSASTYFKQNTSTLGSLDNPSEARPHLGFGFLSSPRRKSKASLDTIKEADSKNSTYTLSGNEESEQSVSSDRCAQASAREIGVSLSQTLDIDKFKHLDKQELQAVIAQASPNADTEYYSNIVKRIIEAKGAAVKDADSLSQHLPSFLETSVEDQTIIEESTPPIAIAEGLDEDDSPAGARSLSPHPAVQKTVAHVKSPSQPSRIPVRSPTSEGSALRPTNAGNTTGTVRRQSGQKKLDSTATSVKTGQKAQRFSSPIKSQPANNKAITSKGRKPQILFDDNKENEENSKQKSDRKAFPVRHRNTVLPDGNIKNTNQQVIQVPSKTSTRDTEPRAKNSRTFPLETNRSSLLWVGVHVGRSEEQEITLRNTLDRDLEVVFVIRGSNVFTLGLSSSMRVVISAFSQHTVPVTFSPPSTEPCSATLTIKPQLGKKLMMKASVPLRGYGGAPTIALANCGHLVNGRFTQDFGEVTGTNRKLSWTIQIWNQGSTAGFFAAEGFRDAECRQPDGGFISIQPSNGVLRPDACVNVAVTVNLSLLDWMANRDRFLGCVILFHGTETCRQLLRAVSRLPDGERIANSPHYLGMNLVQPFGGEAECDEIAFPCGPLDVHHFNDKTHKVTIDLTALVRETGDAFQPMAVEETLSETRLNCTVIPAHVGAQQATIPEENDADESSGAAAEAPPPAPAARVRKPPSPRPKSVQLECNELFFPMTRARRTSNSKVKIKNRAPFKQVLSISPLPAPFVVKHSQVTVQALSFLSLPVSYRPQWAGAQDQAVLALTTQDGHTLTVNLYGRSS